MAARPVASRARSSKIAAVLAPSSTSAIIWPLLAAAPNSLALKGTTAASSISSALAKSATEISGRLGMPTPFSTTRGAGSLRARGAQIVEQALGVAQARQLRRCDDEGLVGRRQHPARPGGPDMGNVEHDIGRGGAQDLEQRIEGRFVEVVDTLDRRRGGEDRQLLAAFRQQAVDQIGVEAIRRKYRFGDALRRILVEVQTRRAERRGRDRRSRSPRRDPGRSTRRDYARCTRRRRRPCSPSPR